MEDCKKINDELKRDTDSPRSQNIEVLNRMSNQFFTSMNLMNTIVGAGIISLPKAFASAGVGLSCILLSICAVLAVYTMICLAICGQKAKIYTYQRLVEHSFGFWGFIICTICQVIFPLCAVLSYDVVIADNITLIFEFFLPSVEVLRNRMLALALPNLLLILPLSLLKNISFLDKFSAASMGLALCYSCIIVFRSFTLSSSVIISPSAWNFGKSGVITSLNMLAFALSCHHNVLPIYRNMKERSVDKFAKASHVSVYFSLGIFTLVAISGYATFAGTVEGNLLNGYCPEDLLAIVCRIIFLITLILTSPLNVFAAREAIIVLFRRKMNFSWWLHILLGVMIVIPCYFVGANVKNFHHVVSLAGSLVAAPTVFIIPAAVMLKFEWADRSKAKINIALAFTTIVIGTILLIAGTVATFYEILTETVSTPKYWCKSSVKYPSLFNETMVEQLTESIWKL